MPVMALRASISSENEKMELGPFNRLNAIAVHWEVTNQE